MSGAILAGVGTAVTAGTSIYGAVAGGGDIPGNEAAVAQALKQYKRKVNEWGQLQSNFGFDSQQLRNEAANLGYLDTLLAQQYMDRPEMNIPGIQPAQERSTGQQVKDIGGAVTSSVGALDDWYR